MRLTALSLQDFLLPAEGIVGSVVDDGVEVASRDIESRACAGELERGADIMRSDSVIPIAYVAKVMLLYVVGFLRTCTSLSTVNADPQIKTGYLHSQHWIVPVPYHTVSGVTDRKGCMW